MFATIYCGICSVKRGFRQKNTQKDRAIYVYIYYIFTKTKQYIVLFTENSRNLTQDIVFYLLTKHKLSVIIIYGRFGIAGFFEEYLKIIKIENLKKKEGEICIR